MSRLSLIVQADARYIPMASKTVQTCITSPPYYRMRNYDEPAQIGTENQTPEEYVAELVGVFREVRRVLKDNGTLWLNLGDSHNNNNGFSRNEKGKSSWFRDGRLSGASDKKALKRSDIKIKDLMGIPWMVAFALRADGWYLRSEIIWHKSNPMPDGARDRPCKAHEQIFLLSKQARYYYDAESVKEQGAYDEIRNLRSVWTVAIARYKGDHPAAFPPKLVEPCIMAGSRRGDIVLDPFSGSGTTGMVAVQNGRRYVGMELNRKYIESNKERTDIVQARMF